MILGQSAATAACFAIDEQIAVQDVEYEKLKSRLLADGQVLEHTVYVSGNGLDPRKLPGLVVDDSKAVLTGRWRSSTSHPTYLGTGYLHDGALADGSCSATFTAKVPNPGKYEVRLIYTPNSNRASNVDVKVEHSQGTAAFKIDQRKKPADQGLFLSLGNFEFAGEGKLTVTNQGADGHVIVDGVQWLPVK